MDIVTHLNDFPDPVCVASGDSANRITDKGESLANTANDVRPLSPLPLTLSQSLTDSLPPVLQNHQLLQLLPRPRQSGLPPRLQPGLLHLAHRPPDLRHEQRARLLRGHGVQSAPGERQFRESSAVAGAGLEWSGAGVSDELRELQEL